MDEALTTGTGEQLIIVKQLPIIEERLREKQAEIKAKTAEACSLACTTETVATVKKVRAALTKEFNAYEADRKAVKQAIMKPYEDFEATYKECIANEFKAADLKLKQMIDNTEYHLRDNKEKAIRLYYNEHLLANNLDVSDWPFERTGIKVNLSDSDTKLKAQVRSWVESTARAVKTINTMEFADEIMVEYKRVLDMGQAILIVNDRHKAAEAAHAARVAQEVKRLREEATSPQEAEMAVAEAPELVTEPEPEEEPILTLHFTVKGTRTKLKALKQFLIDGGYDYE